MTEKLLKKQNANLASAKANLQRELDDTAGQLRQLQSRLAQRETALSVLDRHWAQLELRLGAAKPRLAAGGDASSSAALPRQTLLESLDSGAPAADLDDATRRRCELTAELAEAAASGSGAGDAAASVPPETSAVVAELAVAKDRALLLQRERDDTAARLAGAHSELEQKTKSLEKLNAEVSNLKAAGGGGGASAAAAPEAAAAASSSDADSATAAAVAAASSAEMERLRSEAEAANEERAAFEKLAESARRELIGAQQDVQRLRGDLDEARRRPPTEEQMRAMPQWRHMLEIGERGKQYMQANERLRADMAVLQQRHLAELARLEDVRSRLYEETRGEVENLSKALAQATAGRDAAAHKLQQQALTHRGFEERLSESERLLNLWRQEAVRLKNEASRERARLAELSGARDGALAEKETLRQRVHALELRLSQAPAADPTAAEAKHQDALVRLGGAEAAALQSSEELSKLQTENDALVEELDSIAKAFDESQEQNAKLLKTAQLEALRERTAAAERLVERDAEHKAALEKELRTARDTASKQEEAQRHAAASLDRAQAQALEASREAQQASAALQAEADRARRAGERERQSAGDAAEARAQKKAKEAEQVRDTLERKLKRLERSGAGAAAEPRGGSNEQLDYYRSMVKCPLCKNSNKDTVITKCGHAFCRDCIDSRLSLRERKCPGCSQVFDKSYVKDLWLEYGA
ncbi:hypothetical protein EMIHUDRAFT_462197 [Emiliania huxleyi CCMP1516]|uniref:E3 ubiquitin protein ligase n=2 Tax=Emiliania huxleyi TaxID=2903 RepID=A0A0D3KV62_EMIH1|nr:hypothetical protein EMIHUDRAFT_462197 [Emiliania huxleyi CCMP1516]EOD39647.1 hypothetical protein EMIHUDRAFT_462197 [Emiliania huxleyi CCMP1516]|eukprot:XP_005792076.1 hypothetical protein EMIHUDRAFT_462197 [Emiliania huxleyi CCMP1516]